MTLSTLNLYLDVLMQHSFELMGEAEHWPDSVQEHLRSVWTHVDVMVAIAPLPDAALSELCSHVMGLHQDLDTLERFHLSDKALWHIQVLRSSLDYIKQVIDESRNPNPKFSIAIDSAH